MTEKALNVLEFVKIREILAQNCSTQGAKELAMDLVPSSDIVEVRRRQDRTEDAKRLSGQKGSPSFGNVKDITGACERAEKGAVLSQRELLDCAEVLRTSRGLLEYIKGDKKFDTVLDEIFERLIPDKRIETRISSAIISEEMIADTASPELMEIRSKMRKVSNKVNELMLKFTQGGSFSKYLQENIVTTRGGRFVIPVKS